MAIQFGEEIARLENQMSINRSSLRVVLALLAFSPLLPVAAGPRTSQAPRPLQVRFEFETKGGSDGNAPHSRVFVNANGKRTPVFSADEGFQTLSRAEFTTQQVPREQKVPRDALAACSGWWAGAGDNLYVVRRGARLDVYRQELDEGIEHSLPFRKIKSIRLSPRTR